MTNDTLFKYTLIFGLSLLIAFFLGKNRNIGFLYSFMISILLTPIIGLFITLFSSKYKGVKPKQSNSFEIIGVLIIFFGILIFFISLSNYLSMDYYNEMEPFSTMMFFGSGLSVLGMYLMNKGQGKSFADEYILHLNNPKGNEKTNGLKKSFIPEINEVIKNTNSDDQKKTIEFLGETLKDQSKVNETNYKLDMITNDYLSPGDLAIVYMINPETNKPVAYFDGRVVTRGVTAKGDDYVTFNHNKEHGKTYLVKDLVRKGPFYILSPNAVAIDGKTRVPDASEMNDFIKEVAVQKNLDGNYTYTEHMFLSEFKEELDLLDIKLSDLSEVFSKTRKSAILEHKVVTSTTLNINHNPNDSKDKIKTTINTILQNVNEKRISSNPEINKTSKLEIEKNIILYYIKHVHYYLIIPILLGLLISIGFNSGDYYGRKAYYYNNVGIGKVAITKQKYDALRKGDYTQIYIGTKIVDVEPEDLSIGYEIDWDGVIYKSFTYLLIGFLVFIGLIISYFIELRKYFN
jgi:hypothetical protein